MSKRGSRGSSSPVRDIGLVALAALVGLLCFVALRAAPSSSETSTPDEAPATAPGQTEVVMFGDSYAAGTGASDFSKSWVSLLDAEERWDVENLARGGTGYRAVPPSDQAAAACGQTACPNYQQMIAQATTQAPGLVLVSGGRNDLGNTAAGIETSVDAFYADLRARFPDAQIVALSPIWDDDPAPDLLATERSDVRAAVRSVGGQYVDVGDPLAGSPDLVIADGIHPNDAGHQAIYQAVTDGLTELGDLSQAG